MKTKYTLEVDLDRVCQRISEDLKSFGDWAKDDPQLATDKLKFHVSYVLSASLESIAYDLQEGETYHCFPGFRQNLIDRVENRLLEEAKALRKLEAGALEGTFTEK